MSTPKPVLEQILAELRELRQQVAELRPTRPTRQGPIGRRGPVRSSARAHAILSFLASGAGQDFSLRQICVALNLPIAVVAPQLTRLVTRGQVLRTGQSGSLDPSNAQGGYRYRLVQRT